MGRGSPASVLCMLSGEQRHAYDAELGRLAQPGVSLIFEDSPERALELAGKGNLPLVIVGMAVEEMDGLEFLALLMKRYREFSGKIVVLPDKGDPFPPMLQCRDVASGKSTTEAIDLTRIESLVAELAAAPEAESPPAVPAPVRQSKPQKPKALPARARAAAPSPPSAAMAGPVVPAPIAAQPIVPAPVVAPPPPLVASPEPELSPLAATVLADPVAPSANERMSPVVGNEGLVVPSAPVEPASALVPPIAAAPTPLWTRARRPLLAGALALGAVGVVLALLLNLKNREPAAASATSSAEPSARPAEIAPARAVPAPEPKKNAAPAPSVARPAAAPVDLTRLTSLPLYFAKGSADFSVVDEVELGRLLAQARKSLSEDESARLEVGGHTSQEGAEGFNYELGQRRADSAERYLVTHDIPQERIKLKNYGSSRTLVGATEDADRRVTIRLLGGKGGRTR